MPKLVCILMEMGRSFVCLDNDDKLFLKNQIIGIIINQVITVVGCFGLDSQTKVFVFKRI